MQERPKRNVPMEVLNLGLCRTGTQSYCEAMEKLGYGVGFHMKEIIGSGTIGYWTEKTQALAEGDVSKYPTAAELDRETTNNRTCADGPISFFPEQLLDAYPDALVVMTTRPADAWMRSMNTSILKVLFESDDTPPPMQEFGRVMAKLWGNDFETHGRKFFEDHHQRARDAVAKRGRKMLEINVANADEFLRLCKWLGKEPPSDMVAFPHNDALRAFKRKHKIGEYENLPDDRKDEDDATYNKLMDAANYNGVAKQNGVHAQNGAPMQNGASTNGTSH